MRSDERNDRTESAALQIRLLGAPQITLHGAPVAGLTSAKAQGLLFYLALTGRMHTRSALAALLWGDFPQAAARGNLRKALQQLRAHLGAYLVVERDGVAVAEDADCWVDVVEFDRVLQDVGVAEAPEGVRRAVDLYRGDFLTGFYVHRAPDFENWWLSERARLRELMLEGLRALADYYDRQGNLDDAISLTRRFLDLEPWREEAHRRLMTWLALSGQRGAALAQYEVCRHALADELGVEPAAETTALFMRIRDGDVKPLPGPAIRRVAVEPQRPAFLDGEKEAVVTPREPFVGREPELVRLAKFLKAALAGQQGQVAFVSGEAGWGKTRLLAEFSRRAQENHPNLLVASGACTTFTGTGDPYLPFREILRMLCADVERDWAAGTVSRQHALRLWQALPQVVEALTAQGPHLLDTLVAGEEVLHRAAAHDAVQPGLSERLQELVSRGRDPSQEGRISQEHIFEEVAGVLRAMSQTQPLLLILDDLHWADVSSVSLLFHLGRQLLDSPNLILGAYRPEDISLGREGKEHPLVRVLDELKRLLGDVWIRLGEGEDQGRSFVDALLDSEPNRLGEDFREQLAESTRGHPLFTVEILRDMKEHGHIRQDESGRWVEGSAMYWDALPKRVEGVIERRIHRLDPRLRDVLATASVEGEDFTAEVLARVRGVGEGEMVGLLSGDLARRHRLVWPGGVRRVGETRVSHYRFRHNLFQRHLYHTVDPVQRAYLHEAVGNALEALYRGHTDQIAVHLTRHFKEAGRPGKAVRYLKQAGDAAARVYANAEAVAHYSQAIDLAQEIEVDADDMRLLYTRLGRVLELDSQFEQALAVYEDMEGLAHQTGDRRMELASLMARVTVRAVPTAVHDPFRAQTLGEEALALAGELDDPAAQAKILWNLAVAYYLGNRLARAIESGERSLALAREHDLREQTAQTLNDLGSFIYMYSGRFDQAKEALHEASALWRELGNSPMLADSLASSATVHVFAGEYDRAIVFSEEALDISESIGNQWGQSYSQWQVGFAFWDRGEVSRAINVMDESIRLAESAGFVPPQTNTRSDLAALHGDLGALARGLETAHVALSSGERLKYLADRAKVLGVLAHLHLLSGDLEEAEARIAEAKTDPYRDAWPVLSVTAVLAEGELALQQEAYARCAAVTEGLLTDLRQWGMQSHVPYALYLQGLAFQGSGQKDAARARFLEAHGAAEAIGSRRTLWRILHALSQVEEDLTEAKSLRQGARENVRYIVDQTDQTDLRASFLSLPEVRAVLKPVGPV
jgi:DNA-binding SARP family transcriptional activator